ncbi:MAG TPA: hypothetical protein VH394_09690 [Thermoanaerobaculia bacterium]|jgi:phosphoglycerol transferase MdoB-like AlkP superfamily enzyme|nr:hypothetical protein [Thermoanaerobaculia bacterium]
MKILLVAAFVVFYIVAITIWGLFALRHLPMILIPILSLSFLLDLADKGHGGMAAALFIAMLVLIALAQWGWNILFKRIEAAWEARKTRKPARSRAR